MTQSTSRFRARTCALLLSALAWLAVGAQAQAQTFNQRASFNEAGNAAMIGNVLASCSTTGCASDQNNNNRSMVGINIDPGAGLTNSSSADLNLPAGSTVLFAGLYWGGRASSSSSSRGTLQLRLPGSASYQAITAAEVRTITTDGTSTNASRPYLARADITSLVQALPNGGNGTYYAGGLTNNLVNDSLGSYGGWSLIVLYRNPAEPFRRLMVFDGSAVVTVGNDVTTTVTGLLTPLTGAFNTYMGALTWEGDTTLTGDRFRLQGNNLSDGQNPANNFWNGSITRLGTRVSAKNPDFTNQAGVDIDFIDASGNLANGATSAQMQFTTSQDVYFPHALVFVVDLFVPNLVSSLTKSVVDDNGGDVQPGDLLTYTIDFSNSGNDGATNVVVTDPIPAGTTYHPGSLEVLVNDSNNGGTSNGGATGTMTDAADGDVAEFSGGQVVFRLGSNDAVYDGGTGVSNGGMIRPGYSGRLRFKVRVNSGLADGTVVANEATVNHNAQTLDDFDATGKADADVTVQLGQADLSISKSNGADAVVSGATTTYTVTVDNGGPDAADGAVVSDTPTTPGLSSCAVTACTPANGAACPASGDWPDLLTPAGTPVPTLPAGGQVVFTVQCTVD